jgi:hypothetical protein
MIASRCQIAPDYDSALKEMATNSDQRTLRVGKARHDIGGENINTFRPIAVPNAQPDTSQLPMPRMRRMTEASPRPILSTPFSNDMAVRGMPSSPLAQISRPAYSEEKTAEPIVSPVLSPRDDVMRHACAEGGTSHLVNSATKVPKLLPEQLLQGPNPCRLPEESHPVTVELKSMSAHQPVENKEVQLSYTSLSLEQNQNQVYPGGGTAQKATTPTLALDQLPSPPILSHEFPRPVTEGTKTIVRPIPVPSSPRVQNSFQPAINGNFTVERKPVDRSSSHEKMWVDSSKDVKFDEWRPPHIDFNTLLDLKRPDLVAEERKPPFVAPSYDEVPRLDQEQTNSTRSPTLSSEGVSSLPWTPHIERENYPELAPVQANHSNQPSPRRVDIIDPDSFPEPLSTLQIKGTGTASIVSDDSEPSRFVSSSATSKSKKWGGLFKSNRTATTTSIPHAVFSTSGKSLILWNEGGVGCYDLHNAESIQFRRINTRDIRLAAGGAAHLAVVTKTGTVSFSNLRRTPRFNTNKTLPGLPNGSV